MAIEDQFLRLELRGTHLNPAEEAKLLAEFGASLAAEWLLQMLVQWPLAGSYLEVSRDNDLSGRGVEMKWMRAEDMIEEGTEMHPGVYARKFGYLPVGTCMHGRGAPYFLEVKSSPRDSRLVRIYHDGVSEEAIMPGGLDSVAESLEDFLAVATTG